jgi:adenosylcobinamide-phosphate synthase
VDSFILNLFIILAVLTDFKFADDLLSRFHPVPVIGNLINFLEKLLYPSSENKKIELITGFILTVMVVSGSYCAVKIVLFLSTVTGAILFYPVFFCLVYFAVACGGLAREARNVLETLQNRGLIEARAALARIVGRETDKLTEDDIYRAVIETVAENFSDGVVAPLFYLFLGGLPLAWVYKAINTLDSMLGYKERHYLYFGRSAARLDDIANFIPSRLSALLILAAGMLQGLDWRSGWHILKRDRRAHASPNSAYPEAAMAGILGLRLGGDNYYHGRLVKKPYIGDPLHQISGRHILKAINNLYISSTILVVTVILFSYFF